MLARRWFTCAGNLAATSPGSPCQSTVGSPSSRRPPGWTLPTVRNRPHQPGFDTSVCDSDVDARGNRDRRIRRIGGNMATEEMEQLAALFESGRERFSNNSLGLQDVRDICEGLHAASAEPEDVTYAEVDAGGVPALWCIPAGCDADS